ncbi:MAG TPA: hypothetical protein VFQ39_14505 [Longimicrobium sp.]|nr:hypothetical protein [Longimicrobium sp.]
MMPAVDFDQVPDDARVWIFGAARPLTDDEQERLARAADDFVARWAAHGAPVVGARELRDGRFLLVAADERATGVSGCSIDSLFHALGALETELGVALRDSGLVFWRGADGEVRSAPRSDFRALARAGEVDEDTVVFDNTVATAGDLRAGRWETRFRDAWHARAFPLGAKMS